MNYTPDCDDCPTPVECRAKNDCQVVRQIRHGHEANGEEEIVSDDKDQQCCEVPLIEQLRSVPKDCRTSYAIQWDEDGRETGHALLPVGFMMHRAADALAAMTKRADDDELAYISLKKHVIDCGLEEIEPGLFRNKRAEEAKWRTVYKACPKHQSLPWNFMLVTTALPAVEVCPHCEQEARGKNG